MENSMTYYYYRTFYDSKTVEKDGKEVVEFFEETEETTYERVIEFIEDYYRDVDEILEMMHNGMSFTSNQGAEYWCIEFID